MIITDSEPLWKSMSEYHDHGHDHAINPGGRGGESRNFIGFNYRMMELQGAIGIAQLAKLDTMVNAQKSHKTRLKEAASKIPGVSFRTQLDEQGDSATFFAFTLQSSEHRLKVQEILSDAGVPPICWADNSWHFYPQWEHLLAGKTLARNGWPFCDVGGKKRVVYDPEVLPKSADILSRTLVYPVSVKMGNDRLLQMENAFNAAAEG